MKVHASKSIQQDINKASNMFFDKIPNTQKKFRILNNIHIITCNKETFTSECLLHIGINFKNIIKIYRYKSISIKLDLSRVKAFADKNTYIILDLFIFHLLYNCPKIKFYYGAELRLDRIIHNGFRSTALYRVGTKNKNNILNRKEFIETYAESFYGVNHFRKIYIGEDLKDDMLASKTATTVDMMLKKYFQGEWKEEVGEVISELVCNACSHNKGILIVDIDICDEVSFKEQDNDVTYKALNISVLNIGDNLIYDSIKNNVKNKLYKKDDMVYKHIYKAYNNHKNLFGESYNENDFFTITAFQKRVSSRELESGQFGTGLTRLLQNITGKAEENISYVLSGNNGIGFINELLNVSSEGYAGFNINNDYLKEAPDKKALLACPLFIPGTIYQLHLLWRDSDE